jgi:isochorismate pyruvate lyase
MAQTGRAQRERTRDRTGNRRQERERQLRSEERKAERDEQRKALHAERLAEKKAEKKAVRQARPPEEKAERKAARQARATAAAESGVPIKKADWPIEPPTADGLLTALEVEEAPFDEQYAAVQEYLQTPEAGAIPGTVRTELRRRNLLPRLGNGRVAEVESLAEVGANLDRIDQEIVALLAERAGFVRQAARFEGEAEIRSAERADEMVERVRSLAEQRGLSPILAEQIYRPMVEAFADLELTEVVELRGEG